MNFTYMISNSKKTIVLAFLLFGFIFLHANDLPTHKKTGIAINPFYLFLLVTSGGKSGEQFMSGTVSFFDHENSVEIALPLHYLALGDNYKQYSVDFHYRKYTNGQIDGLYLSGFARLAKLQSDYKKQAKFGVGVGIGAKIFFDNGFYWGGSINIGRYLTSKNNQFVHNSFVFTDDPPFILDIELLKVGYTF